MDLFTQKRARELLERGLEAVSHGHVRLARQSFKASAEKFATAEAFTYWGWMEFSLGNTDEAIRLCKKAIAVDPTFGNPYNDIGSYLVAQGRKDEAIPWLKRATTADRYDARHYPHMNLGRIYLSKEMPFRAVREFRRALELRPGDSEIRRLLDEAVLVLN